MKRNLRRKAAVLAASLLLVAPLCLFSPPVSAQTRTEEEVSTGRFGAEEPEEPGTAPEEDLNAKWLRLGFRLGPSLRFYTPSNDTPYTGGDTHTVAMDLALHANLRLLPFLSIQVETIFTWDNASLWAYRIGANNEIDRYTKDHTSFSLLFPLLVKLDLYPGNFKISPFLGAYCLAPLGNLRASNSLNSEKHSLSWGVSPPLGLLAGLSGTRKMGPGAIVADLRYAADLGCMEAKNGNIEEFRRGMISLTVGYELGFFTRKRGGRP
ncbi:MAG: hypothetical protein LBP23_01620 [Treponema sp.]|jgi:hypothetical protein|nr:hypothetical protein [Treponema sp.]